MININQFEKDVIDGLNKPQKQISSKYFYDDAGDKIFQEIMQLEEYYLPECETEILQNHTHKISALLPFSTYDVIELGAGDGSKTVRFLKLLVELKNDISYYPLDISSNVLASNSKNIKAIIPSIKIHITPGDYFETLHQLKSETSKMILFMGSNIGNYGPKEVISFLKMIYQNMNKNDILLIGVDLRKNPKTILRAYNDAQGVTKKFNLNLLRRINRELDANFNLNQFDHYPYYDPISGISYSYIVSLTSQNVRIGRHNVYFEANELLHTEVSKKYSLKEIEQLKDNTGFRSVHHFLDNKSYFSVSVFKK